MNPRFIQKNCNEGDKVDKRQSEVVLKYKPDIILFELPKGKNSPSTIFNSYDVKNKPLDKIKEIEDGLLIAAKKYPYASSDILVWENIKKLWGQGHDALVYNVDAPHALRKEYFSKLETKYPQVRKDWLFWAHLYIRDSYMAKNIEWVLKRHKDKKKPVIAVFLQSIHWKNVKFLLNCKSRKDKWNYYFGNFPDIKVENIDEKIRQKSKIIYKYWNIVKKFDLYGK